MRLSRAASESPAAFAERCLTHCAELTRVLEDCLEREHAALVARDREAVEQALTAKRECVRRLDEADPREQILARGGAPLGTGSRAELEQTLAGLDPGGGLTERWQRLLTLTARCRELNERNGRLADALTERTRQALTLMRNAAGAGAVVYGPDGLLARPTGELVDTSLTPRTR